MKSKNMIRILIATIVCFSLFLLLTGCNSDKAMYKKATKALAAADYQTAIDFFTQCVDYEDAQNKITECNYLLGDDLYSQELYAEAKVYYENAGEYKDAPNMVFACYYEIGQKLYDDESFADALSNFEQTNGYNDSSTMIRACNYKLAIEQHRSNNFISAIEFYIKSEDYEDAATKISECYYSMGVISQKETDYATAIEYYQNAGSYNDTTERIEECEHLIAVENDTTPPTFSGLDETYYVKCGTTANIYDYLAEKLTDSDDVTKGDIEYDIICDGEAYNNSTGDIDTYYKGNYVITLSATDEAGNLGTYDFSLVVYPVYVTRNYPTPLVYDGEYGTVRLLKAEKGYIEGIDQYKFTFEIENKTDKFVELYFPSSLTTINGYQVGAYYTIRSFGPGNKGRAETHIYYDDIPDDIGWYDHIDTALCVSYEGADSAFLQVPMEIYLNGIG